MIRKSIDGNLPGWNAQKDMLPTPVSGGRIRPHVHPDTRNAAVLILLYQVEYQPYFVLTKRTEKLRKHQGQISLPGGAQEAGETLIETALRETTEELSVDPTRIQVLGALSPLYVEPSLFCIHPVVGFLESRPDFKPNHHEVAEVIEVPLSDLFRADSIRKEVREIRHLRMHVPCFLFSGHKVWGATAMVLAEFAAVIQMNERLSRRRLG